MRKPPIYTSLIAALIAAAFPSAAYALNYDPAVTINGVAYAENMIVAPKATGDGRYQLDLVGSFAQTPNWLGNFAFAVGNTCAATPVYTPQGDIFLPTSPISNHRT